MSAEKDNSQRQMRAKFEIFDRLLVSELGVLNAITILQHSRMKPEIMSHNRGRPFAAQVMFDASRP